VKFSTSDLGFISDKLRQNDKVVDAETCHQIERHLTASVCAIPTNWEGILFNLGHCYRRLSKWTQGTFIVPSHD
jgi:hypothetical protein